MDFLIFKKDILDFFSFNFLNFFLDFLDFYFCFLDFFLIFLDFLVLFILIKVIKVTTKSYQGDYWATKIAKNRPKQHNKLSFFARRAKKASAEGQSPEGPRSGPYLLVKRTTQTYSYYVKK